MATAKTTASAIAAASTPDSATRATRHELGSTAIQPAGARGNASPAGTLHLVQGWEPLCGAQRVRFVFPGLGGSATGTCPDCVQASTPRPRAPRTRAARAS